MAKSKYCKAYLANDLRLFRGWNERVPPLEVAAASEPGESRTEYFFLHDDFVVTASANRDEKVAFDQVTPDWKAFCQTALKFEIPGDGQSVADAHHV